jgi:hypothetical protein
MTDEFFSGRWEGYYAHGEQYSEDRRKIKVGFHVKMVLKEGMLSGICEEYITRVHMGKPATLIGFIEGSHISFVKQYPYAYNVDEDRQITVDKTRPGLPVQYTGVFEPANSTFYGDWKIEAVRGENETWEFFREGSGGEMVSEWAGNAGEKMISGDIIHTFTGSWEMRKV